MAVVRAQASTKAPRGGGSLQASTADAPSAFGAEVLKEGRLVGVFGRLANHSVERMGIFADQNAPASRLDAVEYDRRRGRSRGWSVLQELPRTFKRQGLQVGIGHLRQV